MGRIYDDITQTVGLIPLVRLNRMAGPHGIVLAKNGQSFNPCASVKDRIAKYHDRGGRAAGDSKIPCLSNPPAAIPASAWPSSAPPGATA